MKVKPILAAAALFVMAVALAFWAYGDLGSIGRALSGDVLQDLDLETARERGLVKLRSRRSGLFTLTVELTTERPLPGPLTIPSACRFESGEATCLTVGSRSLDLPRPAIRKPLHFRVLHPDPGTIPSGAGPAAFTGYELNPDVRALTRVIANQRTEVGPAHAALWALIHDVEKKVALEVQVLPASGIRQHLIRLDDLDRAEELLREIGRDPGDFQLFDANAPASEETETPPPERRTPGTRQRPEKRDDPESESGTPEAENSDEKEEKEEETRRKKLALEDPVPRYEFVLRDGKVIRGFWYEKEGGTVTVWVKSGKIFLKDQHIDAIRPITPDSQ